MLGDQLEPGLRDLNRDYLDRRAGAARWGTQATDVDNILRRAVRDTHHDAVGGGGGAAQSGQGRGQPFKLNVAVTNRDERHLVSVRNGVMIYEQGVSDPHAATTFRLKHGELVMTLLPGTPVAARNASGDIVAEGD